ncbi:MAG TPA: hypothetical protein DCG75_01895 [Bacteroidales bacterium]|nr:hypothetical protein [Bacteroidales bacterium]
MKVKIFIKIILVLLLFHVNKVLAQNHTIFGTVTDENSGETLIGVNVAVVGMDVGTTTNNYGFYSITLPVGNYETTYSYIGYKTDTVNLFLKETKQININLQSTITQLDEVVISVVRNNIINPEMNRNTLDIKEIKSIPMVLGEPDVIKSLQLLPGVQTTNEGTTNISIRGGTHDQNLFLLDEAPVYNPDHSLSFFSAFNPDAIKDVSIYKGYFPAQFGGRISSVVDIRMKEGNNQKYAITGSLGIIASSLTLEGPIKSDKTSFIISGRYSYAGVVANGIYELGNIVSIPSLNNFSGDNDVSFYDLTLKINHTINEKNRIYLSSYTGKDNFFFRILSNNSKLNWGNNTFTLRWNHIHNSKLFSNHTFIFSNYGYSYYMLDDQRKFEWISNLKDFNYKTDFDWFVNSNNHVKFGYNISYHFFQPGKIEKSDTSSVIKTFSLGKQRAIEASIYVSSQQMISDNIKLEYGIRYNSFFNMGEGTVFKYDSDMETILDTITYSNGELIKFYDGLEPRVSIAYLFNSKNSLKVSYSRTKQYMLLMSNSSVGMPTDVWLPANKYIEPLISDQYALGYFSRLKNNLEVSVELYYRKIQNIIDFKDNANLFLNNQIETQVRSGNRNAYGLEFMVQKNTGKLTGWLSYTLSKALQKTEDVNNNNWYHPTFDKLHNISLVANYQISKRWYISTTFKYSSGGYATVPKEAYFFDGVPFVQYTERNGYKLPDYHRLDLAINYKCKKNEHRNWQAEWNFGVYNLYNRKNIFSLYTELNSDYQLQTSKLYLFGIVPFVSYNFNL